MSENKNYKIIAIIAIIVGAIGVAIGYSAFSSNLTISSTAEVKPNSNKFKVVFSSSDSAVQTNNITPTLNKQVTGFSATNATIDNTSNPIISNLKATFTEPGQTATYSFYAFNDGEYPAYLNSITFDGNKSCTGKTGTTASLVSAACNSISLSVKVGTDEPVTASARAAVQNVSGGTLNIESGKIYSSGTNGLINAGALYIGINDGAVDTESPEIIGKASGISASAKFNYYDGIIKGINNAISDETKINVMETGYALRKNTETIDGYTYKTIILAEAWKLTYNSNGGTVSPTSKFVLKGESIGNLPTPTRSGYIFLGWFTEKNNGTQIDKNYIINQDSTIYAHWKKNSETAQIGNTKYDTLQEAINATPNNTLTTIQLLKDSSEIITINANKKIVLNMGTNTLSNNGNNPVINNNGEIEIINGNIKTTANHACINQNAGLVTVNGTRIEAVGTRQAIYIYGGTVEVTGDSYLISETSGTPTGGTMERGTVQNLSPGTLIITGGTIIGDRQQAVSNEGSLTIGKKDGNIDNQFPLLVGGVCGVKSSVPFNFYDGAMKGKTTSHIGTFDDTETSSTLVTSTEYYEQELYYIAYLENN